MTYEVDDDQYPATTVVYIEATWNGYGTFVGSGVLVGRNDVLSAAHVVYNAGRGGFADDVRLYPSFNPYASDNVTVDWSVVHYYPGFDPDGDGRLFPGDFSSGTLGETELDIALFTLSEAAGDIYGWMGIDYDFAGGSVGVLGHPVVYETRLMSDIGSVQRAPYNDDAFIYSNDLEVNGGNSGGPVYYDYGNGPYVVGIVSTGIAAVSVGGHEWWLRDYIANNDVAIGGGIFDPNGSGGGGDVFEFRIFVNGRETDTAGDYYDGPVGYLERQLVLSNADEVATGTSYNDFINSGGGTDAIDAGAGNDVLDGGTGSNFLTGGRGIDKFFTDARIPGLITWSTITDFDPAVEEATIWGWSPGVSRGRWVSSDGASGYEGATFHADVDGNGWTDTSITFTGLSQAQIQDPSTFDGLLWFV